MTSIKKPPFVSVSLDREDDEEQTNREGPQCIDCGARSPVTNTNYTLISSKGWRLTLLNTGDGKRRGEWRCPTCWEKHKARNSMPPP
jgi:hypothetical protein